VQGACPACKASRLARSDADTARPSDWTRRSRARAGRPCAAPPSPLTVTGISSYSPYTLTLSRPAQGAKDAKLSTEGPQSSGTAPNSGTHAGWSVSNGSTGGPDSGGGGGAARRGLGGTTTLSDGLGPPSNCRAVLSNVCARTG